MEAGAAAEHGKKSGASWSYNLSEGVLDIQTSYEDITRQNYISVLGEKNFYCLTDGGRLRFMKRLDFSPVCFGQYFLGKFTRNTTKMLENEFICRKWKCHEFSGV